MTCNTPRVARLARAQAHALARAPPCTAPLAPSRGSRPWHARAGAGAGQQGEFSPPIASVQGYPNPNPDPIQVSRETFVDFCILCGCDYTGTIRGVGPMTAFKLLKQHGSIEAVAATLDSCKLPPAESWQVSASLAPLRLSRASAPLCAASPPLHLSASPPLHLSAAAPPRLSAPLHRLHPRRLCTPSSPHRLITPCSAGTVLWLCCAVL